MFYHRIQRRFFRCSEQWSLFPLVFLSLTCWICKAYPVLPAETFSADDIVSISKYLINDVRYAEELCSGIRTARKIDGDSFIDNVNEQGFDKKHVGNISSVSFSDEVRQYMKGTLKEKFSIKERNVKKILNFILRCIYIIDDKKRSGDEGEATQYALILYEVSKKDDYRCVLRGLRAACEKFHTQEGALSDSNSCEENPLAGSFDLRLSTRGKKRQAASPLQLDNNVVSGASGSQAEFQQKEKGFHSAAASHPPSVPPPPPYCFATTVSPSAPHLLDSSPATMVTDNTCRQSEITNKQVFYEGADSKDGEIKLTKNFTRVYDLDKNHKFSVWAQSSEKSEVGKLIPLLPLESKKISLKDISELIKDEMALVDSSLDNNMDRKIIYSHSILAVVSEDGQCVDNMDHPNNFPPQYGGYKFFPRIEVAGTMNDSSSDTALNGDVVIDLMSMAGESRQLSMFFLAGQENSSQCFSQSFSILSPVDQHRPQEGFIPFQKIRTCQEMTGEPHGLISNDFFKTEGNKIAVIATHVRKGKKEECDGVGAACATVMASVNLSDAATSTAVATYSENIAVISEGGVVHIIELYTWIPGGSFSFDNEAALAIKRIFIKSS